MAQSRQLDDRVGLDPTVLARELTAVRNRRRFMPSFKSVIKTNRGFSLRHGRRNLPEGRICVFCGAQSDSHTKEDVIPNWLKSLTGKKDRFVAQGGVFRRPSKKKPFSRYWFSACLGCNKESNLSLEMPTRQTFIQLLNGTSITVEQGRKLLDWFDKVRVGVWVGELTHRENVFNLAPKFFVNDRMATTDRVLIFGAAHLFVNALTFGPLNDPIFTLTPSFFWLAANNLAFVSISSPGVAARLMGLPYFEQSRSQKDGKTVTKLRAPHNGPIRNRLSCMDSGFMALAESIINVPVSSSLPYYSDFVRGFPLGSNRSDLHVVTTQSVRRLSSLDHIALRTGFKTQSDIFHASRAVADEARRWVTYENPPPPITGDDTKDLRERAMYFEHWKLAEAGYLWNY